MCFYIKSIYLHNNERLSNHTMALKRALAFSFASFDLTAITGMIRRRNRSREKAIPEIYKL